MARARSAASARTISTQALVLRRVDYSETDLVLTFFTEAVGKVSALARGARRSQRRFGGALEAMHTLAIRVDERASAELMTLREASIVVPRRQLVGDLDCIEAAGQALAWVRRVAPARTAEPDLWRVVHDLLARLDTPGVVARRELAVAGLRLLSALGWGIDFSRCVRCGRPYEPGRGAFIDPARGGLVCRACGGARQRLTCELVVRLRNSQENATSLEPDDAETTLALVEAALRAHAGV